MGYIVINTGDYQTIPCGFKKLLLGNGTIPSPPQGVLIGLYSKKTVFKTYKEAIVAIASTIDYVIACKHIHWYKYISQFEIVPDTWKADK